MGQPDDGPPRSAIEFRNQPRCRCVVRAGIHGRHRRAAPVAQHEATAKAAASPAGVRVYGFCPMLEDTAAPAMELVHNHNERILTSSLLFGTQVLYDVIKRFCAA